MTENQCSDGEEQLPDVEELAKTVAETNETCLMVLNFRKDGLNHVLRNTTSRKWIGMSSYTYEVISLCNRLVIVKRDTLTCVPLDEVNCDLFFCVYPSNKEETKRFIEAGWIENGIFDTVSDPDILLREMCIYLEFDAQEKIDVEHNDVPYQLKNTLDVPVQLLCYEGECTIRIEGPEKQDTTNTCCEVLDILKWIPVDLD